MLQAICNTDYRFTDVFVGFPESAHDARVLKESSFFENIARKCSDDCILKNAVHPLLPGLMPPYKENQATFQNYKDDLNKYQRAATEKAFGILKQRFRRLYFVDAETTNLKACVRHHLYCKGRDVMDALSRLERQGKWRFEGMRLQLTSLYLWTATAIQFRERNIYTCKQTVAMHATMFCSMVRHRPPPFLQYLWCRSCYKNKKLCDYMIVQVCGSGLLSM